MTFISTRDRARAIDFYARALGAPLLREDDYGVVFDLNGIELRVTTIPDHVPSAHTVLGWHAPDIRSAIAALRAAGVVMTIYEGFGQDADGVWTAPGGAAKIAWFNDPDGNVLSLTEYGVRGAQ